MCEFCTKHGEGQKWYLLMKNYSDELLHEELTAAQQAVAGAADRLEWNQRSTRGFVFPAMGVRLRREKAWKAASPVSARVLSKKEIKKVGNFSNFQPGVAVSSSYRRTRFQ
jgi:hypothetical protein